LQELVRDLPVEIDRLVNRGPQLAPSTPTAGFFVGTDEEKIFRIASPPGAPARLEPFEEGSAYRQGSRISAMLPTGNRGSDRSLGRSSRSLARIRPGRLDLYRMAGQGLALEKSLSIPVRARRDRMSLFLESPRVTLLRSEDELRSQEEQGALYAIGPEAHGNRRLRTVLLKPTGLLKPTDLLNPTVPLQQEADEPHESWALLPGPEEVEESWYGWKDGKPILVVTTFSADKIGIFERHRLRVFPLGADRTRGGRRPLLEATTASRRWQDVRPMILDADGDGRDDLVVFQTEGLANGKLIFEAFLGAPGSGFQLTSRKTVLATQPDRWKYGSDLTGDGVADLVTFGDGQLEVFAGTGGGRRRGRHLVERKASQTVSMEAVTEERRRVVEIGVGVEGAEAESTLFDGSVSLRVADLDGDGTSEVLILDEGKNAQGVVRILRFRS